MIRRLPSLAGLQRHALLPDDGCETSSNNRHRPDTNFFIDHPLGICQKILIFSENNFDAILKN